MRKAKKSKTTPSPQDKEFERLYRTIPFSYKDNNPLFEQQPGHGKQGQGVPGKKQPKAPQPRWKKFLKRTLIVLAIILLLAGAWVGWKFIANGVKIFGWGGLKDIFTSKELRGEDTGRVNILLAGNSADDPGHGGAELTDSIMVVSIDTKNNKGYILSIPRDLYVNIPGHGYAKINEAYQDGERSKFHESGYAEGGMGLLQKTIGQQLDITFHYYALVNYAALKQAVNAVGGVTITINSTDSRGLYDPSPDLLNNYEPLVDLPNGKVKLNGTQALGLARARGNAYGSYGFGTSDFARTEHQRLLLLGLKSKATSASTLANPVKIGKLFDSIGNNVETDFEVSEIRRLYEIMKEIPNSRIKSASLNDANGVNLLQSYRTDSGQSALVPAAGVDNYTAIKKYLDSL